MPLSPSNATSSAAARTLTSTGALKLGCVTGGSGDDSKETATRKEDVLSGTGRDKMRT